MPQWTEPQAAAIAARGGHVVCSAAAGAGKTAVLTERVVRLVGDGQAPLDVPELLVVTFTRSAAAEMRGRIAAALQAGRSPRLVRQAWLLPRADITTLHGFCERTLRRHFAEAGLDPAFSLLDPAEAERELQEALEAALQARYQAAGAGQHAFLNTVAHYGGRSLDAALRPLALRLRAFAQSLPDPEVWLAAQGSALAEPGFGAARDAACGILARAARRTLRALALAERADGPATYIPALEADAAMLAALQAAAAGPWDDFAAGLCLAAFQPLKAMGAGVDPLLAERVRALRDATKRAVATLAQGPWGRAAAELTAEAAGVAEVLTPLLAVVADLQRRYAEAKDRRHALDFADLEHRCLALLRTEAGEAVRGRYREVLVDEAQDLSPVQDALLAELCRDGRRTPLFSVGDARQSIYGFRLADPRRFLERARRYAEDGGGTRIALPHNFRSRRLVVGAVNFLFDALLRADGSDIPEREAGPLVYGADYGEADPPAELHLLDGDVEDPESTAAQREAACVAALCAAWVGRAPVRAGDGTRPARPGDIAILLRAPGGVEPLYAEALRACGLRCWSPAGAGRAASPEVRAVLAWLTVLDNPRQDIPLAATLLGPFGGFSAADLARLRRDAPRGDLWRALTRGARHGRGDLGRRARAWLGRLEGWRTQARLRRFGDLVASALAASAFVAAVAGLPGGAERRRHLEWVEERCRQAEADAALELGDLPEFLRGGEAEAAAAEAASAPTDAVRLLSVHASKGLEFPLVVVAGLGRRFNLADRLGDVLVHREAGIGARAVDLERRLRWPTLRHAGVAARLEADGRAEELRILYVALTRARERLALVGTVRGLATRAAEWVTLAGGPPDLGEGSSALDWIGPVLATHPDVGGALAAVADLAPPAPAPGAAASRWMVTLHQGSQADPPAGEGVAAAPPPGPETPAGPGGAAATEPAATPASGPPALGEGFAATLERLRAEAAWTYPWAASADLYAKVSVGELRDRSLPEEEPGAALEIPQAPPPRRLRRTRGLHARLDGYRGRGAPAAAGRGGARRPPGRNAMAEAGPREPAPWRDRATAPLRRGARAPESPSAAEVGSATHLVLRYVEPGGGRAAIQRCLESLLERRALTAAAAGAVDSASLARFLERPLGQRLRAAHASGTLRREVPFSLRLAAAEVHGTGVAGWADGEWVLVQGMIDALLVEADGLTVLDYKTDRPAGAADLAAAIARHSRQLGWYARAAGAAWGRPVRAAWLVFLGLDRDIPCPLPPPKRGQREW